MNTLRRFAGTALAAAALTVAGAPRAELPSPLHPDGHLGVVVTVGGADLAFAVPGRLASVTVRLGEGVRGGQPLAELDADEARSTLEIGEAELSAARAARSRAQSEFVLARETLARRRGAPDLFAAEEIDAAVQAAEVARAGVEIADAEVRRREQLLARADAELAATQLQAPSAGVVAEIYRRPGAVLAAGDPIVRLGGTTGLSVRFAVPPAAARELQRGGRVDVVPAPGAAPLAATVVGVAPEIDPASGLRFAEATIDDADGSPPALTAGAQVRVRLR